MRKKTLLISSITILVLVIALIISYRSFISVWSSNILSNHFEQGDKIYASQILFDNNYGFIGLFKEIRPLTTTEINDLDVSESDKLQIKKAVDQAPGPYMVSVQKYLEGANMEKRHSAYIGLYKFHKFLRAPSKEKELIMANFYAIEPENSVLHDAHYDPDPPKGYIWASKDLYVVAEETGGREPKKFQK